MNARISPLSLSAALAFLAFSTSAFAAESQSGQTSSVPVSVTVDAAGLDLSTPAGAERLHRAIVTAAKEACGQTPGSYRGVARRTHEVEHVRPCVEGSVRAALEQVAAVTGHDLEQVAGVGRFASGLAASR